MCRSNFDGSTMGIRVVTAALGILMLVGCTRVVDGAPGKDPAPPAAESAPTVAISGLPELLPQLDEVRKIMSAPELAVEATVNGISAATPDQGGVPSVPECAGVMYSANEKAYRGSGYTGLIGQRLAEPSKPSPHVVTQAAVAFPSVTKAEEFFAAETDSWNHCAGKSLTSTFTQGEETFALGRPTASENTLTMVSVQEGGEGWTCSRALGWKANVIADVNACQNGATDQGEKIMSSILDRIAN